MASGKYTIALEADPNDPEDRAVTVEGVEQALAERRARRARGAQKSPTKQMVSIRMDADVLERWKATGSGWQTRVNEVLRKAAP